MTSPRDRVGCVLVAAALLTIAGCGSGIGPIVAPGPLDSTTSPVSYCLSATPGAGIAIGSDLVRNDGSTPVVVKRVALAGSSGLRLLGALVVPVASPGLVGNGWKFPLTRTEVSEFTPGVAWTIRYPATGATIPPSRPGALLNLVVGVAAGKGGGSYSGLEVFYQAGSKSYTLNTAVSVVVHVPPQHC